MTDSSGLPGEALTKQLERDVNRLVVDRGLAFIDAELRSLAFRRDALLRVRELLAAAYPISERFGED